MAITDEANKGDFIDLVRAVAVIGEGIKHVSEDVRELKGSQDSYIVEHRATHATDRVISEKQIIAVESSVKNSVKEQLSVGRKVYYSLISSLILVVAADVLVRILGR